VTWISRVITLKSPYEIGFWSKIKQFDWSNEIM